MRCCTRGVWDSERRTRVDCRNTGKRHASGNIHSVRCKHCRQEDNLYTSITWPECSCCDHYNMERTNCRLEILPSPILPTPIRWDGRAWVNGVTVEDDLATRRGINSALYAFYAARCQKRTTQIVSRVVSFCSTCEGKCWGHGSYVDEL